MNKDLTVWKGALIRGLVVTGLAFFGMAVSQGSSVDLLCSSFLTGGAYMFVELAKYYGIDLPKTSTKSTKAYSFILFP